jgi:predicted Zn-dependent protease
MTWPDDPSAFDAWPDGGTSLRSDLHSLSSRLLSQIEEGGDGTIEARVRRAVVLSAALEHVEALVEADRLVTLEPRSARFRRLRSSIHHRAGRWTEALEEIAQGLAIAPEDPGLLQLRGRLRVASGESEDGVIDLKVALERGSSAAFGFELAQGLARLGRHTEAVEVWAVLVRDQPHDVRGWIGLARSRRALGEYDLALVAIEEASGWVDDRSPLLGRVALEYAACTMARPSRMTRLIDLGRRGLASFHSGG